MFPDAFHQAAEKTDDPHDRAELHAAGTVLAMIGGMPHDVDHIHRWVGGLMWAHAPLGGSEVDRPTPGPAKPQI